MRRVLDVLTSLSAVCDDNGAPTGVMVLKPFHFVGGKVVGVGVNTRSNEPREYGVVVGSRLLPKHRSKAPLSPDDVSIRGEGKRATICLSGVSVKTVNIS